MSFPVERFAAALLFLYPVLLLTVRSGANACFLLLIILAFYELLRSPREFFVGVSDKTFLLYSAAMASLAVATLISQTYHMKFTLNPYDAASRFVLAVPVYLLLRRFPTRYLTVLQYGFICAALATILIAALFHYSSANRLGTYFM